MLLASSWEISICIPVWFWTCFPARLSHIRCPGKIVPSWSPLHLRPHGSNALQTLASFFTAIKGLNISHRFRQLLHERSVEQFFSNSGKPHDNAVAESFFATLKKEDLYRKDYTSEAAFKRGLASYIEFYNTQRPHRTLKNQTPCQIEELFKSGNQ